MTTPPRAALIAALLLLLLLPGAARPQSAYGAAPVYLGGLAEAIAAAAVVSGAIIYMVRYNKRNITGCVQTVDGISSRSTGAASADTRSRAPHFRTAGSST